MRALLVVRSAPAFDVEAGVREAEEVVLVVAFVPKAAIE